MRLKTVNTTVDTNTTLSEECCIKKKTDRKLSVQVHKVKFDIYQVRKVFCFMIESSLLLLLLWGANSYRLLLGEGKGGELRVTIASKITHPTDILVDIVAPDHVHDGACIFLCKPVLELGRKALVSWLNKWFGLHVLVSWRKSLRAW